jgi:hypothetical protein
VDEDLEFSGLKRRVGANHQALLVPSRPLPALFKKQKGSLLLRLRRGLYHLELQSAFAVAASRRLGMFHLHVMVRHGCIDESQYID